MVRELEKRTGALGPAWAIGGRMEWRLWWEAMADIVLGFPETLGYWCVNLCKERKWDGDACHEWLPGLLVGKEGVHGLLILMFDVDIDIDVDIDMSGARVIVGVTSSPEGEIPTKY